MLVLAQLLARNNPGDPLINLLNPVQQPPAPQQNPQPVQPAPAISESQDQSHIAPVQQPIPDDVTRRLDSLEKLIAEHRGAPPPHHAADSIPHPLNTNITLEPYPTGFKIPQLETYDGTKDPDDHLHAFYSCMQAQNASDALMCKIFPSTLRGNARTWYYSLPPRSISSYTEMASAFATKFSSRGLIRKTTTELMRVKQRDGESLKNYMSRFNDAVLEVSSFDQAVGIAVVISGLKHDRFRDSLIKHAATTFSEVNDRSLKFITAEEYALAQNPPSSKNQNPEWRDDNRSRKKMRMAQNRGPMLTSPTRFGRPNSTPPQQSAGKPPVNWTPFNLPRSQIFMQIKNKMDLRRPGPIRTAAASRDHTKYCDFHQDHGHTTEQCNSLKFELESLAQKGMLNEYVQRVEQPRFIREQRLQPQGVRNPPNRQGVGYQQAPPPLPPPARIIHMITEGLEAGGLSSKQRKLYVREVKHQNRAQKRKIDDAEWKNQPITFTSANLDTVVTPHNDPLVTSVMINNCEVQCVLVDTGSAPDIMTYVTPSVKFLVVKMASSFNIVIGRPTLIEIRAVVSQSHLCMKFPTPMGIATLRGNQEVARHCYITSQVMGVEIVDNRPEDETRATPVEDVEEVLIDDRDPNRKTQIGTRLNPEERAELIAFLRANNDVPMAPEDEEKTAFYAGDEIYCYVMMSFGLKNAGATYQKMIRAIAEMEPPKSVKDIQRLTGRVAALHRFISKSADKCLPFFKIMRLAAQKDESGKQKKFEWSQECQAAFEELKSYLSSPPLLTKAVDGELLYLYLGVSDEAISSVLVREEAKPQKPIYYISSVLHGAELRYPIAEKAALAVVTSARKLRPYFQSHPIIVLTDQPLGQILQKPECFGRLIKWAVELGEFEITFQQRSAIRAQALADFIVECTPCPSTSNPEPNDWTLYVDEASSSKGSGAGALLIGPDGYRSEHALKFNFDVTNNMAEYEALLLGLQLALELKISYVALVAELKCKFQKFCLSKIPLTENEQADSLSKFASDSSSHSRSVFVEVLDEPSFMKPRMMEISTNPDTPSWTDSIISFLRDGTVPEDRQEAMKLRKKASRYTLVDGVLYKRSFSLPLLRCLNPYEAEYALREVHEGVCGSHVGARTLAHKVLRQGYYWPNMYKDAIHFVQKCLRCQFFAHLTHQPAEELTTLVAPWPFAQWGLDLLGPFVKGVGGVTHLVVGVDYFTKWVEARPLSSLTSKKVALIIADLSIGVSTPSSTSGLCRSSRSASAD
ncbi:hypothetical protein SLEP1_g47864 [Rubroshorea leprosula]|uniref:Integrase catalytic domain-containing protein n=1 Tax=Rubroshorea leprosula TaxID=152421 RepID=A0AAV5LU69_9ROSI|nr:hypothetical protein SLEP1_g47864 [Rubroshorea leprosula]